MDGIKSTALLKPVLERKTWGEARRRCQSMGADLASISSENMFISEMLPDGAQGMITTEFLLCSKGFSFIVNNILWIAAAHSINQPLAPTYMHHWVRLCR